MKTLDKSFASKSLAPIRFPRLSTAAGHILQEYEFIITSVMQNIANRYSRDAAYKWINTKFNSITGADFDEKDPVKGLNTVYAWIQGRGLEAIITHIKWLKTHTAHRELVNKIEAIAHDLLYGLRKCRQLNDGHLFFSITPEGFPYDPVKQERIDLGPNAPYNFSDLFCSKGMYAAAHYFKDADLILESRSYCLAVIDAITSGCFVNDQFQYNGRNPHPVNFSCRSHAPYSLALGTVILLLEYEKNESLEKLGLDLLEYVIANHVNTDSRWSNMENYVLVEFIENSGTPYLMNGCIVGDPGHAIEFAGYGIKLCSMLNRLCPSKRYRLREIQASLFEIVQVHFKKGFNAQFGGIYKSIDLITGDSINSEFPWWSLPETMKTALLAFDEARSFSQKQMFLDIYFQCNNSFLKYYIQTKPYLLIAQTRNEKGELIDTIPATPDNDPGYHTGMSLIECYAILDK